MAEARFGVALQALVAVILCTMGCGKGDTGMAIAVIPKQTGGEFWETVERGATAAAEDLGVRMRWEGTLTETNIAEQSRIIENMTNLQVDGIALAPLNRRVQRKSVENAVAAGIPVVIFDSALDGDAFVSFIATNNEQGGVIAAQHMIELLGEKKSRVLVLRFVQGTGSTEARAKGFIDTVTAANIEVVADPYPEDGTVAGAKKTASNTFERFINGDKLDMDGIFACNLYTAQGMAAALDDLRKSGVEVSARCIGFDTSPKLLRGLEGGTIDALVSQRPEKMGYLAVEMLVKHLRGEPIEAVVDTGVELVTKERLQNEPEIRKLVGLE